MKYQAIKQAIFLERVNRFIAVIEIEGRIENCHVKNTGRCRELLVPGRTIYVDESQNPKRKTKYSLIGVDKNGTLINMDSQAPNIVVKEWLLRGGLIQGLISLRAEQTYGNSRFDFAARTENEKILIEVKGVTLEENGVAKFPDAPTIRGVKHIKELIDSIDNGYIAYLIFVVQMKGVHRFQPNVLTQPAFGEILNEAKEKGVHMVAVDCIVTEDTLDIDHEIEIQLNVDNVR